MAKKRFSSGLDDLFSDNYAASMTERGGVEVFVGNTSPVAVERKHHAHKNFLSDLDSLLQEALEESLEKFEASQPDSVTPSGKSKSRNGGNSSQFAIGGLDALIRQTIDIQEINADEISGKKRLTVSVDKSKLEKLKTIARLKNAYLKDFLIEVLDGYIEDYVKEKGIDL